MKKATFGAGCFWEVEETFRQIDGVTKTTVGYLGGHLDNPTYEQVCEDNTGHAEVVELIYDPSKINYNELLNVFFKNHNPTTLNRQGVDVGTQYRSAIFYHDNEQREKASIAKSKLDNSDTWSRPIVTEITKASRFFPAEDYHQKYFLKNGVNHCNI